MTRDCDQAWQAVEFSLSLELLGPPRARKRGRSKVCAVACLGNGLAFRFISLVDVAKY